MLARFAMRLTEEYLSMLSAFTGEDVNATFNDNFDGNSYVVIEALSLTEYHVKIMSEDSVLEELKKDSTLEILS